MKSFFKAFGLGILYVITLPIMVVVLALGMIYCIGLFFYMGVRALVSFFTGRRLFAELPEDKEARKIIESQGTTYSDDSSNPFKGTDEPVQDAIVYKDVDENTWQNTDDFGEDNYHD